MLKRKFIIFIITLTYDSSKRIITIRTPVEKLALFYYHLKVWNTEATKTVYRNKNLATVSTSS